MKNAKRSVLAAGLVVSVCLGAASANAQELYKAQVEATGVTTNNNGGLVYTHYDNHQIITDAAAAAGLSDKKGLRLVYNRTADDLEVVSGTNNTVIAVPLTFNDGVILSKTKGKDQVTERLAWVFVGPSTTANGTLRSTERLHLGKSNQVTNFSLIGRLQFGVPAADTNGAAIYSGVIMAGPLVQTPGHVH